MRSYNNSFAFLLDRNRYALGCGIIRGFATFLLRYGDKFSRLVRLTGSYASEKRGRAIKINRELSRDILARITSEMSRGGSHEAITRIRAWRICIFLQRRKENGRERAEKRTNSLVGTRPENIVKVSARQRVNRCTNGLRQSPRRLRSGMQPRWALR